jgi:hypothetical protein
MRQELGNQMVFVRWQAGQRISQIGIRIMLVALPPAQTADDYEALRPWNLVLPAE